MGKPARPHLYLTGELRKRYARAKGKLLAADLFTDTAGVIADMEHLAAVLRMFEPGADVEAIAAVRPHRRDRGHWSREALKMLREANAPMRGRELARRVMLAQGLDPSDHKRLFSIEASLQSVLLRLARMGFVRISGKPRRWAIEP